MKTIIHGLNGQLVYYLSEEWFTFIFGPPICNVSVLQ